ncbi:hypothetical protein [Prosthecobacter sp.]|uniref:hypothetical protein n=1 Tax=Prosthecobacter sp. TaxID=1965333 RepID=UPI003784BFE1
MKAFFVLMILGLGCAASAEKPDAAAAAAAAAAAERARKEVITNEPEEGIVIEERELGMFERIDPEKTLFTPTRAVPLVENLGYGWRLKVDTDRPSVVVRHEVHMPEAPESWVALSPGSIVSEDRKSVSSTEELKVKQGNLFQYWYFTKGDPEGVYVMRAFINDRLVGEFMFKVERPFPERVQDFLASEWTELSICAVVGSVDHRVTGTCVKLERESAKGPVSYSLPLGEAAPANATVKEEDLEELYSEARAAAKAAYEHRHPLEVLQDVPLGRAWEMLKSGAIKFERTDVEVLMIRGKNAKGAVELMDCGPFARLDTTIQRLFQTKAVEMNREQQQKVLGVDLQAWKRS